MAKAKAKKSKQATAHEQVQETPQATEWAKSDRSHVVL